jgi:hypothetical protein
MGEVKAERVATDFRKVLLSTVLNCSSNVTSRAKKSRKLADLLGGFEEGGDEDNEGEGEML